MRLLDGMQSALAPAGPEAAAIAQTSWLLFGGAAAIFVVVIVLTALALVGAPRWLAGRSFVVFGGIVFPATVLMALLVHSLLGAPRLSAASTPPELVIEVVGEQWWWRVQYLDADGHPEFATANEIRLPVGGNVELRLRSADVLHSFWVPALAGKLDMIPGRVNRLVVAADRPGTWRGQCAEFCGGPHAQMALYVIAEAPEAFAQWRDAQRAPASSADRSRGAQVFLSHCAVCHAVRGSTAAGAVGPDLTHLASRVSIGAGALPNDADALRRWIAQSQHVKPGNLMPEFAAFGDEELRALVEFLASLR